MLLLLFPFVVYTILLSSMFPGELNTVVIESLREECFGKNVKKPWKVSVYKFTDIPLYI